MLRAARHLKRVALLNTHQFVLKIFIVYQRLDRQLLHDETLVHDVGPAGKLFGDAQPLFDQQDRRRMPGIDRAQLLHNLVNDRRLDTFGRLVQQEQTRVRCHRTGNRQNLLLASAQSPAEDIQAILEDRELVQQIGDIRIITLAGQRADAKVIQYRQARENQAALRHIRDAKLGPCMRWQAANVAALELDPPVPDRYQPDYRLQQRAFADAVTPQQGDDFSIADRQTNTVEDWRAAIIGLYVNNLNDGRASPGKCPGPPRWSAGRPRCRSQKPGPGETLPPRRPGDGRNPYHARR